MMLSVWIDAVVAALLVATIGYSMLLNKRLTAVRHDREKFADVIKNLTTASQRAETAVANLRNTAEDMGRRLDKKTEEARALTDDLAYMIERGGTIADKLAASIRSGRDRVRAEAPIESHLEFAAEAPIERRPEHKPEHKIEPLPRPAPRAEAPRPAAPAPRRQPIPQEPRIVAERVTAPVQDRATATSRAERELLRALARRR